MTSVAMVRMARWWPVIFATAWIVFAVWPTQPQPFGSILVSRLLATAGAVLMFAVAFHPERQTLRVAATLVAFTFPLFRFVSLLIQPIPGVATASRITAMTAWALIGLTLLFLYPAIWLAGWHKEQSRNGQ